jgi:hypothetical protein
MAENENPEDDLPRMEDYETDPPFIKELEGYLSLHFGAHVHYVLVFGKEGEDFSHIASNIPSSATKRALKNVAAWLKRHGAKGDPQA